tara:strand:- start:23602 stop:24030 length:429 start_codon:yes stop_codon:yes gene_type:complete
MSCNGNISNTCADPILSSCVDHEGALGVNTKITDGCVTQRDVNGDLYAITDETISKTNVSELTSACMDIPVGSSIAEVVTIYESEICALKAKVQALEEIDYSQIDITNFGIVIPACIADACDNPPVTLAEWMQVMMDQHPCV